MLEPNPDRAVVGEALEGLPGSKSVARVAEAARNQGDPAGSRRTNYEGQAGNHPHWPLNRLATRRCLTPAGAGRVSSIPLRGNPG